MKSQGIDTNKIWDQIKDLVIKTILVYFYYNFLFIYYKINFLTLKSLVIIT